MLTKAWLLFNEIKQGISFFTGSLLFDPDSHFLGLLASSGRVYEAEDIIFDMFNPPSCK